MTVQLDASVADRVKRALSAKETQRGLAYIADEEDAEAAVRADVMAEADTILAETEAHRTARDAAVERDDAVTQAMRRLVRIRDLAGWAALVSVVAALCAALVVAVSSSLEWGMAFSILTAAAFGLFYAWIAALVAHDSQAHRLRLAERRRESDAARERYAQVLNDEITAAIRRSVNRRLRSMATRFSIIDQRGLRELADPEREVATEGTRQLWTLMSSLAGGSLGISGPRGCGKTTLINRFATGRSVLPDAERRGLVVSAPVAYEARDFVLHLFACVCERIMNPQGSTFEETRRDQLRRARLAGLGVAFVVGAVLAIATGALMLFTERTVPDGPEETGLFLLVVGGLAFEFGCLLYWGKVLEERRLRQARDARRRESSDGDDDEEAGAQAVRFKPERIAEQRLEEIRYQQTLASGWSANVGLPLGSKLGGESKLTLARAPWTLPEIVDEFRSYVATLTKSHYLVIGIDELDKIDDLDDAQKFLNDIKGVFGVRGCFYLVSVSEDAMSNFERRGMPFRDVFDSSFDAILRVRHLKLAESREVLESRVTGLPVPYQCLCHVIAGGLPRDLVRVARELVHQYEPGVRDDMRALSRAVIASELQGKVAAAEVAVRATVGGERDSFLAWIQDHDALTPTAAGLRERFNTLVGRGVAPITTPDGPEARLRALALELMAFDYYAATVLEFFAKEEGELTTYLIDADQSPPDLCTRAIAALETLACARQQFAMSPALAVADVAVFRNATDLEPWTLPAGLVTEGRNGRVHAGSHGRLG